MDGTRTKEDEGRRRGQGFDGGEMEYSRRYDAQTSIASLS